MLSAAPESRGPAPGSRRHAPWRDAPRRLRRARMSASSTRTRRAPTHRRRDRGAPRAPRGFLKAHRCLRDLNNAGAPSTLADRARPQRAVSLVRLVGTQVRPSRLHSAPASLRRGILGSQPARPSRPSVDISGPLDSSPRGHRDAANCRSFAAAAATLFAADHRPPRDGHTLAPLTLGDRAAWRSTRHGRRARRPPQSARRGSRIAAATR
jgi:hypothetical protein